MENMNKEKTILIFKRNGDNRIYKVNGTFDILEKSFIPTFKKTNNGVSKYPEFYDVKIQYKESENDEYHELTSETLKYKNYWDWKVIYLGGVMTTPNEILQHVIAGIIQGNKNIEVISMNEDIKQMIDEYRNDAIKINHDGKEGKIEKIPNVVLHDDMYLVYELLLVTDKSIYYVCDDLTIVLDINDHTLVTDSSFGCDSLFDTLEKIIDGKAKVLYLEKIEDFEY